MHAHMPLTVRPKPPANQSQSAGGQRKPGSKGPTNHPNRNVRLRSLFCRRLWCCVSVAYPGNSLLSARRTDWDRCDKPVPGPQFLAHKTPELPELQQLVSGMAHSHLLKSMRVCNPHQLLLSPQYHTQQLNIRGLLTSSRAAARQATDSSATPIEVITSTANNLVKHCVKLRTNARYRSSNNQFVLTGMHLLQEAAGGQGGCLHAKVLFLQQTSPTRTSPAQVPPWLHADRVVGVTEAVMKKLTGLENVDNVEAMAQLDMQPWTDLTAWRAGTQHAHHTISRQQADIHRSEGDTVASHVQPTGHSQQQQQQQAHVSQPDVAGRDGTIVSYGSAAATQLQQHATDRRLRRLLALDGVQDPGNLGTLIRSALAFGWDAVYLLPGCCDPWNEKSVRASRGGVLRVPLSTGTLDTLDQVCRQHKLQLIAAEPEPEEDIAPLGNSLPDQDTGVCLVLGSEGQGLSDQVAQACAPVSIPMVGDMESLNVGVAGSILMYMLSPGAQTQLAARLSRLGLTPLGAAVV